MRQDSGNGFRAAGKGGNEPATKRPCLRKGGCFPVALSGGQSCSTDRIADAERLTSCRPAALRFQTGAKPNDDEENVAVSKFAGGTLA